MNKEEIEELYARGDELRKKRDQIFEDGGGDVASREFYKSLTDEDASQYRASLRRKIADDERHEKEARYGTPEQQELRRLRGRVQNYKVFGWTLLMPAALILFFIQNCSG